MKGMEFLDQLSDYSHLKKDSVTQSGELTTCGRVLLEKLIVTQLVKKLPRFYKTLKFIIGITSVRDWTLS
jgi:hypothetical protein